MLVSLLIFSVGALSLVVARGYSYGFFFLAFWGLALGLRHKAEAWPQAVRPFFVPLFAYALGGMGLALLDKWHLSSIDPYYPFVFLLFGFWAITHHKPKAGWFWAGLGVGAMAAAGLAAYQTLILGQRAYGNSMAIQFGNAAVLLGVLCLLRVLVAFRTLPFWMNALLMAGCMSGLLASVWSQTRGGWIAVPLVVLWVAKRSTSSWTSRHRFGLGVGVAVVIAVTLLMLPQHNVLKQRTHEAVTEVRAFVEKGKQASSVGSRLAMWRVALQAIQQHPLFGSGQTGWEVARDAAIQSGGLHNFSAKFGHVHNEYLDVAVKKGLVGLSLLLALYIGPIFYFRRYLTGYSAEVKSLAMAGIVIPMMYMDFSLTQAYLSHNSGRMVLVSLWLCVVGLLHNAVLDETQAR